jgi:hypothetical protein
MGVIDASVVDEDWSGFREGCGIDASFAWGWDAPLALEGCGADESPAITEVVPVASDESVVADCRIHASQSRKRETIKTINKIERRVSIPKLTFESVLHRSGLRNRIVA